MNKFDNYVYYTICENSIKFCERDTDFITYRNFCMTFKHSIKQKNFSTSDNLFLKGIITELKLMYDLSDKEIEEYLCNYFLQEKFLVFEEPVKRYMAAFPNG